MEFNTDENVEIKKKGKPFKINIMIYKLSRRKFKTRFNTLHLMKDHLYN